MDGWVDGCTLLLLLRCCCWEAAGDCGAWPLHLQ
jgi:hypothetical protein